MDAIAKATRQSVRMRGRSYVAFTFCPVVPIAGWLEELDATVARSPGFFVGKPVVLDLSAVDLSQSAISHLVASLEQRNIRILGVEGVDADRLTTSMPPLLTGGRGCILVQNELKKPEAKPKPASLVLASPVRSGQSTLAKAMSPCSARSVLVRRLSPAGPSMFTERFAAARWQASAATRQREFSVRRSKPSYLPLTATTRLLKK
jgi:Septum formation inhibitor MinC, N-terminal domain